MFLSPVLIVCLHYGLWESAFMTYAYGKSGNNARPSTRSYGMRARQVVFSYGWGFKKPCTQCLATEEWLICRHLWFMLDIHRFDYFIVDLNQFHIFETLQNMERVISLVFLIPKEFTFNTRRIINYEILDYVENSFKCYVVWFHICPMEILTFLTFGIILKILLIRYWISLDALMN